MDAVAAVTPQASTTPVTPARRMPAAGAVLREQLATAWMLLRAEILLLALVMAGGTVLLLVGHLRTGRAGDFYLPDMAPVALLAGLLTPAALWRREPPARREYFRAMPVDRMRHTLARVFAGWGWLLLLVAAYLAWAVSLSLAFGGDVSLGPLRTRALQPELVTGTGMVDFGMAGNAWLWLVPFTAATAGYLLVSTVVLVADHPWRSFAVLVLAILLVSLLAQGVGMGVPHVVHETVLGRYGIDALAIGLSNQRVDPSLVPPTAEGWLSLPDRRAWAVTTAAYVTIGLAGVLLAARKHQER